MNWRNVICRWKRVSQGSDHAADTSNNGDSTSGAAPSDAVIEEGISKLDAKRTRELNRVVRRIDAAFDSLGKEFDRGLESVLMRVEGRCKALTDPLDTITRETVAINQQLEALRDYAAQQHDLTRRFQDGYDLKILRDVSLRVMLVVDNIDKADSAASSGNGAVRLDQVRDDLLLALDASGMEAFAPQINVLYRGLEKDVEVIRTQPVENPHQDGKIIGIVRRGLRYLAPDGAARLIRTAQVVVAKQRGSGT